MKHQLLVPIILLWILLVPGKTNAQMPDGAIAPDWTHTDIFGNSHNLYDLLDEGKMVVIEFSATWCGPCWNYMLTGALEDFWEEHGPDGTGQAQAFYFEGDFTTDLDDLYGLTPESQGNWVEAIPFPIIDLQPGQNTAGDYQIAYYPTLYAVCADRKIYELGQVPAAQWEAFMTSCTLAAEVDDVEPAVCFGDGEVTLNVSGGVNPISYDWSNGDDGPTLENVGAGTYSVTVTEGNGKDVVIEDIVITGEEFPIELAFAEVEEALCFETSTGNINIELENGNGPYSYDWSNGAQTQNLSNVPAGFYTVNATDVNGCPFEESFEIDEPEELLATYETTPDYCDQGNGTITLDIEGGVGNYSISSSDGDVFGDEIVNLFAGIVVATIEDGNGCIWEENVEVEFEAAPELFFSPNPNISCIQPSISVTGYVQGGSGDFVYEWSTTNGNIVGPNNQASVTVDQEGDYILHVTDLFSSCPVENEIEVTSSVDPPTVTAGSDTPISCEDLILDLQGSGDPANSIIWTTSNGNIVSGGNTYIPTVDAPGLYIIEVINPINNCSNVDSVVVINDLQPADAEYQYLTSGLTIMGTDMSTGSNLSGWSWTFGDGNTSTEPNAVHTYAAEGNYEVCLSVENGCGTSISCLQVEVTSSGSSISVIPEIHHVLCNAGSDGSISVIVNGGTGTYSYIWTGPGGQIYTDPVISDLPAGVYQLVVSDDEGNLFIGEFTITEPTAIVLVGSTVVDNLCFGQANGSVSVDLSGGVGPFTYSFNNGPSQIENAILNLPAGAVEGIVTDANGCAFAVGPYSIQEPPVIGHEAAVSSVRCFGESNGAINLTVTGGVAPYAYLWNSGSHTTSELNDLPAGNYVCQITDHNGCLSEASVAVVQPDVLAVQNTVIVDATGAAQNNGSVHIEVTGGVSPYVVTWNNGATGTFIEGLTPGEYWYQITDANGCITNNATPVVINGIVSTTNVDWAELISISPNPSKGDVMVSWKGLNVENGTMTLVTLDGKPLRSKIITSGTGNWDLTEAGLTSGVYIVLFKMDGQSVSFKLVVL